MERGRPQVEYELNCPGDESPKKNEVNRIWRQDEQLYCFDLRNISFEKAGNYRLKLQVKMDDDEVAAPVLTWPFEVQPGTMASEEACFLLLYMEG